MVYNPCLVCQTQIIPMTGICGWDAIPCHSPLHLDDCGVCGGTNSKYRGAQGAGMNLTAQLESRAVSGLCNYQGYKCGCAVNGQPVAVPLTSIQRAQEVCVPATVSVCGTCVLLDSAWKQPLANQPDTTETFKNVGICDCSGNGVPGGGAILDRCGVCNGHNASMDYCGISADIPSSLVCHTGSSASSGSSTWNLSCTGCNGVPDPLLPWFPSPESINHGYGIGGVRVDACGVCGGDSSTCAGCDGVPGSNAKTDVCGVCGGTGLSCRGCDGVSRLQPLVNDSCGVCGGSKFGACQCSYGADAATQVACEVGCDGVIGSGLKIDPCGMCGGNGSTCAGCDGVPWSGKVWDTCGNCVLASMACEGCDGVRNSFKRYDCHGVCNGGGLQCKITPCSDDTSLDECGACVQPGMANRSCGGCDNVPYSMLQVDVCGVCDGNGRSCIHRLAAQIATCDGVRGHIYDICGVCNGHGTNASGSCANPSAQSVQAVLRLTGISSIVEFQAIQPIFIAAVLDAAASPSAVSSAQLQIAQVCGPSGTGQPCSVGTLTRPEPPQGAVDVTVEVQVANLGAAARAAQEALRRRQFLAQLNASLTESQVEGVTPTWVLPPCFGYDICGQRCGSGRECLVCGPCGRNSSGHCVATDACGKCGGDGTECHGCDGVPYSGLTFDACGVCGGNGASCKGCDGIPNSGARLDRCGVCGGGNRNLDQCGCCPASTPLCYLTPSSILCPPLCTADNTTCMGCDGAENSGRAVDACGVCGGTNLCKFAVQTVQIGGRRAGGNGSEGHSGLGDESVLFRASQAGEGAAARRSPPAVRWLSALAVLAAVVAAVARRP